MPTAVRSPRRVLASDEVVALGRAQGLDAVGIAPASAFATTRRHLDDRRTAGLDAGMRFTYLHPERSTDPATAVPDARALVVAARSYRRVEAADSGDHDPSAPRGRVARYAWDDHYQALKVALTVIARALKDQGWRARVLADDNALVDREAAYRAGLGWYGKNANLLLPGEGSWFVLGSVVTDAPLAATTERVADGCGTCTRCLDGCPTGAIVAPGVVDARRCLAWLLQVEGAFPREHRVALGDRLYGCDDCQEVCPPNRRVERTTDAPAAREGSQATVDLLDLLAARDDELLDRHGRWYVPRRQARYLRRNALVVLGNVADPADERVAVALRRALTHDDGLVRAHAVWAARRLGRDDLLTGAGRPTGDASTAPRDDVTGRGTFLDDDPDPLVRAELAAPVERR